MKNNIKHFKKWLALLLAVVLVGGICVVTRGGSLRATEGEPAEENAEETEIVSEPEEIILSDEGSGTEDAAETTEAQPEEETEAVVPEGGTGENVEGEEPVIKEETDSPDAEEVKSEEETPEEEKSEEELLPEEEEVEKVERSVKVVSSLEGVETVEEGTPLTLTAHLTGYDDVEYELQWQQSEDGTNWDDIEGENDLEYTVILTKDNEGYLWRVSVSDSES